MDAAAAMEGGGEGQAAAAAAAAAAAEEGGNNGGGSSAGGGGFFLNRPALGRKLFKLKSLDELQDTEANNDDSQFRVRSHCVSEKIYTY